MLKKIYSIRNKGFNTNIFSNKIYKTTFKKRFIHVDKDTDYNKQRELLSCYPGGSIDLEKVENSGLAIITINNESKKNAISGKMMLDLSQIIDDLEKWPPGKMLILKGSNKIFCSGADFDLMKGLLDLGKKGCGLLSAFMQTTLSRLYKLPLISIAMIEGYALGGGAELSTACDFRALGHEAFIGFVHTRMGLSANWGAPLRNSFKIFPSKTFPIYFPIKTDFVDVVYDNNEVSKRKNKLSDDVPVVLLLGWSGSSERHMKKFAQELYNNQISISVISPILISFTSLFYLKSLAKNILNFIKDQKLEKHPLFIHYFSNGGGIIYSQLSQLLKQKEYCHLNLFGTIIDSAPSNIYFFSKIRVYRMITEENLLQMFIKFLFPMLFYAAEICWLNLLSLLKLKNYISYPQNLIEDQTTCDQLYLYSKRDKLISYKFIQEHIKKRMKKKINKIEQFCWEDSEHVAHFYKYKLIYSKLCLKFLENCLNNYKSKIN